MLLATTTLRRWVLRSLVASVLAGAGVYWLCPKSALYPSELKFSQALRDRNGQLLHLALTPDSKYRLQTPLAEINASVVDATLEMEDRNFYAHCGVAPLSLLRAAWGVVSGSRLGGGSTITMQYARLRYSLKTRSLLGKLTQMWAALQLERHYSKDEILEAYFNLAPYGGNVEGIGAASVLWCGKSAKELSLREAVALAVLPQSPTRRRPHVTAENVAAKQASFRLWQRVANAKGIPSGGLDADFALRPEARAPREVPHLARRLFNKAPQLDTINSTIDLAKQHSMERAMSSYLAQRREVGIANACALLVHAPTREVLGYVGSAGFLNDSILGQVDGVMARRSPGSALKPFVYALAMDQGLIQPRTLVRDGRVSFGDYNPENFDREFTGPIPACEALFRSRNIPAVTLTQRLAAPGLYGFLKQADVAFPKPESFYGLALPLGGAEVSMEELAQLYCLLADDGEVRPLKMSRDAVDAQHASDAQRLSMLSPASRFLTREMLRAPTGFESVIDPELTWKTGTSHGFRDAWAAGMRGEYVLVVWIGNFSGKGNAAFVARDSAAPLLFSVFEQLHLPRHVSPPPASVAKVELCAVSGEIPTAQCTHRLEGWFMPGISPIAPCQIHREVLIDPTTQQRVARDDGSRALRHEVYEFWPPDMLELFRLAGVPRAEPPPLEGGANLAAATNSNAHTLRILSPLSTRIYAVSGSDAARQTIPLKAEVAAGVSKVFWFVGKRCLGSCGPQESLLWQAQPGKHTLQVVDDQGRSASSNVRVEQVQ